MTKKLNDIVGGAREQINELSRKTLGSYVKKAALDLPRRVSQVNHDANAGWTPSGSFRAYERSSKKLENRKMGILTAADKLTKEEADTINVVNEEIESYLRFIGTLSEEEFEEEYNQLDELSKKTLSNYIKRASHSLKGSSQTFGRTALNHKEKDRSERAWNQGQKRIKGINTAADKLAKEEITK